MRVRRRHVYDGSARAGQPIGPVVEVVPFARRCAEGPLTAEPAVCFPDGSWEFLWNAVIQDDARLGDPA